MNNGFSERDLIRHIAANCGGPAGDRLVKGIGDDCAVYRADSGMLGLLTTDTLVQGIHFDLAWHPPELLGRKAASVNLSDIAAMGGKPLYALLSLAVPAGFSRQTLEDFLTGFAAVLADHQVALVGGDTVRTGREAMFSVTVVGEVAENQVLYRSGARVGDLILVSGFLGEAAAGLALCRADRRPAPNHSWAALVKAHCDPVAQVDLGRRLAACGMVHAMMDLSDGLATDLAHLCAQSGCGAEIDGEALPLSAPTLAAADDFGLAPQEWALKGGEDFQLLFTTASENVEALVRYCRDETGVDCTPVGRIVRETGVVLSFGGTRREIAYQGYDHFA